MRIHSQGNAAGSGAGAAGAAGLGAREAEILNGLLETFFAAGGPVGSRALAERHPDGLSPASIRHVLAELEDAGYLDQPHTSAGRVPTTKAIRWWVQQLGAPAPLAGGETRHFERVLLEANDETTLWLRASEFLSEVTQQLGVIAVRPWRDTGLKQIRFFRLTDRRVLAILVAADGQVRERVSRVPEVYTQAELDAAARYFNHHFNGSTLARIRRELERKLDEERAAYDALLKRVVVLYHCGVLEMQDAGEVYFQGASHLGGLLENENLSGLLGRINQKERWLRLFDEVSDEGGETGRDGDGELSLAGGLRIRVGLEREQMPELALITAHYRIAEHGQGAIGILGSTRMPYERALSAVTLVREMFHRVLGDNEV